VKTAIIIPTLNEEGNIELLVHNICDKLRGKEFTIVIVDDNSSDRTQEIAHEMEEVYPVRLLARPRKMGLASAVIDGMNFIKAENYIVMDADFSHPVELLPVMIESLNEFDLVIASRYVSGGGTAGWPLKRRCISLVASYLARPLAPIKDNCSGFFGIRAECLKDVELEAIGYKIGLEIQVKANWHTFKELPIIFKDRTKGQSKLGKKVMSDYLRHLFRLYRWKLLH
jgi:dolichol-phosphate mannosyltransferase